MDVANLVVGPTTLGLFHLALKTPDGISNDAGTTPGWRTNAGLGSVPSNVKLFFNRWQNNGFFPWDYTTTAQLPVDDPMATAQDQASQETTDRYRQSDDGLGWGISLALGEVDLNPVTTRKVNVNFTGIGPPIYVNEPTLNDNFGSTDRQQHLTLPDNHTVQADLIKDLIGLDLPPSISGTGGDDHFVIKASSTPGPSR